MVAHRQLRLRALLVALEETLLDIRGEVRASPDLVLTTLVRGSSCSSTPSVTRAIDATSAVTSRVSRNGVFVGARCVGFVSFKNIMHRVFFG